MRQKCEIYYFCSIYTSICCSIDNDKVLQKILDLYIVLCIWTRFIMLSLFLIRIPLVFMSLKRFIISSSYSFKPFVNGLVYWCFIIKKKLRFTCSMSCVLLWICLEVNTQFEPKHFLYNTCFSLVIEFPVHSWCYCNSSLHMDFDQWVMG